MPYVVSAAHCWGLYTWQVEGPSRTRVAAFLGILLSGAVVVNMALIDAFGHIEGMNLFYLLVGQLALYLWSGEWILDSV